MKRFMRGIVAVIIAAGVMGGPAYAQDACDGALVISNTGPGSTNEIKCVDSNTVRVTCTNDVYVVNNNSQTSESGDATNSSNTTGGSSITGNATNENGTTVQIGASCAAAPVVTTPEDKPNQPTPGGMGAGQVAGVSTEAAPGAQQVALLPNTTGNSIVKTIVTSIAALIGTVAMSRLAVVLYRRIALT